MNKVVEIQLEQLMRDIHNHTIAHSGDITPNNAQFLFSCSRRIAVILDLIANEKRKN